MDAPDARIKRNSVNVPKFLDKTELTEYTIMVTSQYFEGIEELRIEFHSKALNGKSRKS